MSISRFELITIFLLINLILGTGVSNARLPNYFPVEVGHSWVYTPSYGDGLRTDTIIGTEDVGGTLTYILEREEAAPDNYREKRWLAKNDSDLILHKFWTNVVQDPAASMTAPLIWYDSNPDVGDTWSLEFDLGDTHVKVTHYVESLTDTVTVPAGVFYDCIRIRTLYEITENGATRYDYEKGWLAPDVGPIMYNDYTTDWHSVDFSQQLVSFSNTGLLHVDINTNQDSYHVGDTLRPTLSIYNSGSCKTADLYVVFHPQNGTSLFYPGYRPTLRRALPTPIEICGSPFLSDRLLLNFTIPITFPSGSYSWSAFLSPVWADPRNSFKWMSYDEAPFNVD